MPKGTPKNGTNKGWFYKGMKTWNKGLKGMHVSPKTEWKKGQCMGIKNINWKGNKAGYTSIHMWVKLHKGKPYYCEICGTNEKRKYNWANIDHKYKRILKDYISLCIPCHYKYDKGRRN
jgi:hypothetical protein